ncbi:RNA polymerase sigma-70 factor (ECF subfamily) [Chitinophaga niastensis]|uniref:RNA polymerase sigma-70 factor (ECF subfamily) n=1 Tax=Chitinophaga niastensis TaxID=536980 RepID=A0A2P8HK91_CHINA|nr:RNA polymerase sigma-70 factor [Chitinophaga niastensis]PSL46639.1 RNA polymerase sigma-70 factor (ECF subfamily) [Chitinophaga niastensis]
MNSKQPDYTSFWESGDIASFKELMKAFSASLQYFACSIVCNQEEAEEIVADVFIKIWQQRQHLPSPENIKFYLFKAVKNTALNYLKSNGRRITHHAAWEIQVNRHKNQNPEDILISKEQVTLIQSVIQSLPPRCRQIFILIKEDGLTYEQVAVLLDLSKATVNVQMTLAMKKIWAALDPVLKYSHS